MVTARTGSFVQQFARALMNGMSCDVIRTGRIAGGIKGHKEGP